MNRFHQNVHGVYENKDYWNIAVFVQLSGCVHVAI